MRVFDSHSRQVRVGSRVDPYDDDTYQCPAGTVTRISEEDGDGHVYVEVTHDGPDSDGDRVIRYTARHLGYRSTDPSDYEAEELTVTTTD